VQGLAPLQSSPLVPCGYRSTRGVCNQLFDFESLSEPPRIPAMPSADRANGALCHERKWTVCSPQPIRCNPTVQSEDVFVRSAFSAPMTSSLSALHRK